MSDCHISIGAARSKRRGGFGRAGAAGLFCARPSSWSTRRTDVSLTPSPCSRPSSSRIRRDPYSGCAPRSAVIASRVGPSRLSPARGAATPAGFGASASSPPSSYNATQLRIVSGWMPYTRATSDTSAPCSVSSISTRTRSSSGYANAGRGARGVAGPPPARPRHAPGPPDFFFLRAILSLLPGSSVRLGRGDDAR